MKAALLPDRGVVKVAGDDARNFLHGLLSAPISSSSRRGRRASARCCRRKARSSPISSSSKRRRRTAAAFFLDLPRALRQIARGKTQPLQAAFPRDRRGFVRRPRRARGLGWRRHVRAFGLAYADPRLPALGLRVMVPPHRAAEAAADLGAILVDASEYEAHRIALGIPRGGVDFSYGDAFPHEADMDQLGGVDFAKGCYVGQEVVSRMEHRGIARTRAVPVRYDGATPRRPAPRSWPASAKSAPWARRPPAAASRCCASTGWRRRCRAASRSLPAAFRSG